MLSVNLNEICCPFPKRFNIALNLQYQKNLR